jgi:hypothetical protein
MPALQRRLALLALLLFAACRAPAAAPPLAAPPVAATAAPLAPPNVAAPPAEASAEPAPTPPPPPPDAAAAIDDLLRRRERAALARDRAAFLETVAVGEPEFAVEQANWFQDGALRPLVAYSLQVSELALDGDRATGEVEESWRLGDGRVGRSLRYEARFQREADGWRFAGPNFAAVEGAHFAVRGYPSAAKLAAALLPVLEEIYGLTVADLGVAPAGRTAVKLYPSEEMLQGSVYPSYTQPLTGWNEPNEAIKIRVREGSSAAGLRPVLAHEFTHNLLFALAGGTHGAYPWWVEEGTAEFEAGAFLGVDARFQRDLAFQRVVAAGGLVDWSAIDDFMTASPSAFPRAYDQGRSMVAYIGEAYGADRRNAWLRAMAGGADLDNATRTALGPSFEAVSRDWRARL